MHNFTSAPLLFCGKRSPFDQPTKIQLVAIASYMIIIVFFDIATCVQLTSLVL